jgi:diguanylate cyclase (GGDEF)-like protein/PAS domain S-box-containing protein
VTSAEGFLRDELVAAKRIRKAVWILRIAIDDRDAVNSRHGDHLAEALAVQVAGRARAVLRAQDQLCSLARNELVLICPGLGRTDALRLAQRVRAVMAAPFQVGAVEVGEMVTVSVFESSVDSTTESLLGTPGEEAATRRWPTIRRTDTDQGSGSPERRPGPGPRAQRTARRGMRGRADAAQTHSTDLVMCFGPDGTIEFASSASRQMLGWNPEDLVGLNGFDLIEPADHGTAAAAFASIPNLGDHVRVEFRVTDARGRTRWLEETATNLIDDPAVACIVGNVRDVTERVELLRTIEADRRRLAEAQAAAKLGSFELNLDTLEIIRSDELWRMLGLEPGADAGSDLDFVHPDDRERVRATIAQSLDGRDHGECTHRILRADGAVRWVLSQATRLGAPSSNRVIGTMLDITERHEAESALNHQATHDWLTSLPNAASLHRLLDTAIAATEPDARVAVAIVDLDHFKLVNDRTGHAAGDEAIREVAARLRRGMSDCDIVARLGGDEFVVVRTGVVTLSGAAALGEQALGAVRDALTIGESQVRLTVSVGVALSTATDSPTSLLQDADDAMYQSKRDGRNRLTVFDDSARARPPSAQRLGSAPARARTQRTAPRISTDPRCRNTPDRRLRSAVALGAPRARTNRPR